MNELFCSTESAWLDSITTELITEAEEKLNKILCDYLHHNGFQPISVHTSKDGLKRWQEARSNLILLDNRRV